jgi:hypothetical protein
MEVEFQLMNRLHLIRMESLVWPIDLNHVGPLLETLSILARVL